MKTAEARRLDGLRITPLRDAGFGCRAEFDDVSVEAVLAGAGRHAAALLDAFYAARGLMIVPGLGALREAPRALVEFSRLFGPEVENYRETLTSERFFHADVDEILVLSNAPPCCHPPPPRAGSGHGELAVQFPRQVNWHTDQSYRRPPPDVTLLLALDLPPPDQGQTLFADNTAALAALAPALRARIEGLEGIHAPSWVGRSRRAIETGETPLALLPHQLPQRHPLVRRHPVTGADSLYICEEKQMDYIDGPIAGLEPGPDGDGARLLRELLAHATRPEFVYVHRWTAGDLVIADNRNLLHCATWYDAARFTRLMWRTTVMGNPGEAYAGEARSWIPRDGSAIMAGMENA